MSKVLDNGKGFRFTVLWLEDQYGRKDKLTFILSKGTVLIREHYECYFGFDVNGALLIYERKPNYNGPMMNGSSWSDRALSGWSFSPSEPIVIELKKILAEEAIHQVVLGGI